MEKRLQVVSRQERLNNWVSQVMECRNSGIFIHAWCLEIGLKQRTYYYWQRYLFQELSARQDCQESGSLQGPRSAAEDRLFTPQQYRWLTEGLSVDQPMVHKPVISMEGV